MNRLVTIQVLITIESCIHKHEPMPVCQFEMPEEWVEAADEMGVTYSEYVRRMTRVGRRQMGYDYDPEEVPQDVKSLKLEEDAKKVDTDVVREFILRNLSTEEYHGVDDLVELVKQDIAETAEKLEVEGKLDGSVSKGGWKKK
jgi:hypothetical protein